MDEQMYDILKENPEVYEITLHVRRDGCRADVVWKGGHGKIPPSSGRQNTSARAIEIISNKLSKLKEKTDGSKN